MASTYTWNGGSGRWDNGLDWTDTATSGTGTAPGPADTATIGGDTAYPGFDLVDGPGAAALLTTTYDVAFDGDFTFGTWDANGYYDTLIEPGAVVTVGTLVLASYIELAAGTLDVGTLTLSGGITLDNGALLEIASLAATPAGGYVGAIILDATSSAEIGGAGIGTPGTLAIDPGVTAALGAAGALLDDGVLVDTQDTTLEGPVTGTGQITFGTTSTYGEYLFLTATVGAGVSIAFTGAGQTIEIGAYNGPAIAISAPISGFAAGDAITTDLAAVIGASYTATGAGVGTLAFTGTGGAVLESLTLLGDYTGDTFVFTPEAGDGGVVELGATSVLPTPTPAVTNPGTDAYGWTVGAAGGYWDVAANWTDTTTGTPAIVAPGATNTAVLAGPTAYDAAPFVVTGNGNALSVTTSGALALNGTFTAGSFVVGVSNSYEVASLALLQGAALTAAQTAIYGSLDLLGATITAAGMLTLGSDYTFGAASLSDGASITTGQLYDDFAPITLDSTSSIEVGTANDATPGALTVDSGALASFYADTLAANLVNDGTVDLLSDYYRSQDVFDGPVTGTGLIYLGANDDYGYVAFDGGIGAGQTVQEVSSESTIDFGAGAPFAATITGLLSTDAFLFAPDVATATYGGGADSGVLTLADSMGNVVYSLDVAGSGIGGDTFFVLPDQPARLATGTTTATEVLLLNGALQSGPPPAPAPGSTAGQPFSWASGSGGAWNTPANWGTTIAPGSLDTVDLDAPGGYFQVISGSGDAASASENAGNVLSGTFDFGTLTLNQNATANGFVDVASGSTLDIGDATLNAGTLEAVGAGASISVSGTLTLGTTQYFQPDLTVVGGAAMQVAALTIATTNSSYDDATITVDGTSSLEIGTAGGAGAGLLTVDAGASLLPASGIDTFERINAAVLNNGSFGNASFVPGTVYQTTTIDGAVSGTGTLLVGSGALLVSGPIAATQTIAFAAGGSLTLGAPTAATITGFDQSDSIVLPGALTTASYAATGADSGVLTLSGAGGASATLNLVGDYSGDSFIAFPSAEEEADPTYVTLAAPPAPEAACYAEGTRILTAEGEVAIEALRPGCRVVTAAGGLREVVWTGHRRVDIAHHPRPWDVMPVRVRAHAFGPCQPARDLILSPDHAAYVDGVLIPVRYLLNGASVVQERADRITWWHVELDAHDVVLAEGLPAESYLDTGNRSAFSGCGPATRLHPDFARDIRAAGGYAALAITGAAVQGVRERLLARLPSLGHRVTDDPDPRILAGDTWLEPQVWGEWLCVVAPDATRVLRLVSRTARPAELHADSDDWRVLGLPVASLRIDGTEIALDAAVFGQGWWDMADGLRWSNGDATLTVEPGSVVEMRLPRYLKYHCTDVRKASLAA